MKPQLLFSALALAATLCACSQTNKTNETTTSPTERGPTSPAHQTRFVTVAGPRSADSIRLEVLDWGGTGEPLLFLAGLGNTAHVYDEFAPKFTDQYHVYALTRRGFGRSSKPQTGYDARTLALDIVVVLDSLHISKVRLVGHSFGGDEMSKFASTYPNRVDRLVYLDAAYDRTNLMQMMANIPGQPNPTAKDSISIASFTTYLTELIGAPIPAEETKEISVFSNEGRFIRDPTPAFIFPAIISAVEHPDYQRIQCPALAIYAEHTTVENAFPFYNRLNAADRKRAQAGMPIMTKYTTAEENRFRREVKQGKVVGIKDASHYVFLSHPSETEKLMRDFLKADL